MANTVGEVEIKVKPDTKGFRKELRRQLKREVKDFNEKVKVNVEIASGTREKLNSELEELRRKLDDKELELKPELSKAHKRRIEAELSTLKAKVRTEIDKSSQAATAAKIAVATRPRTIPLRLVLKNQEVKKVGTVLAGLTGGNLFVGFARHFREFLMNIDKSIPMVVGLTTAMYGLGGAILSSTASLFTLSRSLAEIGPAALAVPGILGGVAIGLGATLAVFKDFNQEIPGVVKRLSSIQKQMSSTFWETARGPIQNLINTVLPKFRAGLNETAGSLSTFFSGLSNGLSREFGGDAIANMFDDLNESIESMSKRTGSIARLFRIFGEAGAGQLPALSNWVGKLTDDFAKFMTEAQQTGKLDFWISRSATRMKDLGRATGNFFSMMTGIARAADRASEGDALNNLADALGRAADVVNGSKFQNRLTGVLRASSEMFDRISQKSGPAFTNYLDKMSQTVQRTMPRAGDAIGDLLGGIFEMLSRPAVQNGMQKLVDGIARGAKSLRPALSVLGDKIGATLELLGEAAATIGKTLGAAIEALAPIMTVILKAFTALAKAIGAIPQPIMKMVAILGAAYLAFSKLKGIMTTFGGAFTRVGSAFAGITGTAATAQQNISGVATSVEGTAARTERATGRMTGAFNRMKSSFQTNKMMLKGFAGSAGIGGLVTSMGNAAQKGNTLTDVLGGGLSGALTGLAFGGPIGALIGGVGGAGLTGLVAAFSNSEAAARKQKEELRKNAAIADAQGFYQNLIGTLDQLSGSYTKSSRAAVGSALVDDNGKMHDWVQTLSDAGIKMRTITGAIMGNKAAVAQVQGTYNKLGTEIERNNSKLADLKDAYAEATQSGEDGLVDPQAKVELQKQIDKLEARNKTIKDSRDALNDHIGDLEKARNAQRDMANATAPLNELLKIQVKDLKQWPKSVRTKLEAEGVPETLKELQDLNLDFDKMNNRQVTTLLKAMGVKDVKGVLKDIRDDTFQTQKQSNENLKQIKLPKIKDDGSFLSMWRRAMRGMGTATQAGVGGANAALKNIGKAKPNQQIASNTQALMGKVARNISNFVTKSNGNLTKVGSKKANTSPFMSSLTGAINKVQKTTQNGQRQANQNLGKVGQAKPNMSNFISATGKGVTNAITVAKAIAIAGSAAIGANIANGAASGIMSRVASIAAAARAMVTTALIAARAAAAIHSPSRVFRDKVGKEIGRGVEEGVKRRKKALGKVMRNLMQGARKVGVKGAASLNQRIQKVLNQANNLTDNKAFKKRIKNLRKQNNKIVSEYKKLAGQIKQKNKEIKQAANQYRDSIRDTVQQSANPVDVPLQTFNGMIHNYDAAIKRAREFNKTIRALRKLGLNNLTMQQLLDAGPETALETAKQIANQGKAGVKEINKLQKNLNQASANVGKVARASMLESGKQAAAGFLQGLKSKQKQINKQMRNFAQSLVKTVRKQLKIKSPSRVFMEIGSFVGQGFTEGVNKERSAANKAVRSLSDFGVNSPVTPGSHGASYSKQSSITSNTYNINLSTMSGKSERTNLFNSANKVKAAIQTA